MKIDFEFPTEYGVFRDALHFPNDQPLPSDDVLELLKQQRLQKWFESINNPPPSVQEA